MKKLLCLFLLMGAARVLPAQHVYTIKADSVKITNSCDTAELIIENHTQDVPGFLFNKGKGRTEFRTALQQLNDSVYLVGADSLKLPNAWLQGGNSFGTNGYFGTNDNNPIDIYTNSTQRARYTTTGNLLLGTLSDTGYKLNVNGQLRAGATSLIGVADPASIGQSTTGLKVYGNFQVTTATQNGSNGGFSVIYSPYGRPGATSLTLNNASMTAYDNKLYFGAAASQFFAVKEYSYADLTGGPFTATKYAVGTDSDPANYNGSSAAFGVSAVSEFNIGADYPSTSNYYFLETRLGNPQTSSNTGLTAVRTPLKLDARQLWLCTGNYKPGTEAARIVENGHILMGSTTDNGDKLQVTGNTTLTGNLVATGSTIQFSGLSSDTTQNRVIVSDASGNLYYRDASTLAANDLIGSSLAVNGPIRAEKLTLTRSGNWPDYVFDKTYHRPSLTKLAQYLNQYKHLPGIPSATEVSREGIDVGNNQAALLKKIEELTLYLIEQDQQLQQQATEIRLLQQQNKTLASLQEQVRELKSLLSPQP